MSDTFWQQIAFQDAKESIDRLISKPDKYIATGYVGITSEVTDFESCIDFVLKKINQIKERIKEHDFVFSICICTEFSQKILEHVVDLENLDELTTKCRNYCNVYDDVSMTLIIAKKTMDLFQINQKLYYYESKYVCKGTPTEEYILLRQKYYKENKDEYENEGEYHFISGFLFGIPLCCIYYFINGMKNEELLHDTPSGKQFYFGYKLCGRCINHILEYHYPENRCHNKCCYTK